ncbi:hypothetical protein BUALT_Bualt10G0075000 [Buddleja alternifolia]|uniref:Uncharacterized protein n=1 Tax=Buddleja alternifolia TaxID=168488 RepID=A0AAV6WWU8_9LAMI|nr:hypothetical protein BUALT_Bualt10G0075000 [Buddleja alternifolia]
MEDFGNTLADSRLLDAGFEGEPFTWTNRRLWQRLDRALILIDWADCFSSTRVIHHPRGISDHSPFEVIADSSPRGTPTCFRFQNMWIKHHDFYQSSKENWSQPIEAFSMLKFHLKLVRLKTFLKSRNKSIFGNILQSVIIAEKEAAEAEANFDHCPIERNLTKMNRKNASLKLARAMESYYWKQKSSCK